MTDDLSCNEFVELVTAYLEDALDVPEIARVTAHLRECYGCDRYLAQFRDTITMLAEHSQPPPPGGALSDAARRQLLAAFASIPPS